MAITVLFVLTSSVTITFYFNSTISLLKYLENQPQSNSGNEITMSLPNSLRTVANLFNDFLKTGIKDGRISSKATTDLFKVDASVR